MAKIEYIVVHHSATPTTWSVEDIRRLHVDENGWKDIGYHWVVHLNEEGTRAITSQGRPQNEDEHLEPWEYGAHCRGNNYRSLGICTVGNWSKEEMNPRIRTELIATLVRLCLDLKLSPEQAIRGHNEMPNTSTECPGTKVSMVRLRRDVGAYLEIVKSVMENMFLWKKSKPSGES